MNHRHRLIGLLPCLAALGAAGLAGCAETELVTHAVKEIREAAEPEKPAARGAYKVGKPYQVDGVWYYPAVDYEYEATGIASWYGDDFHGRPTANGETFDMNRVTAAHKTLPLPSMARVTNLENGRSIVVRVNDRGPFVHGRIIDLSRRSAQLLGFEKKGTAKVRVEVLPEESRSLAMGTAAEPGAAEAASEVEVKAAPRIEVTSEALPPPPGAEAAPAPEPQFAARTDQVIDAAAPETTVAHGEPSEQVVLVEPVGPANIYLQAGAFVQYDNAVRLRARLSPLGRVRVTPVTVGEQQMFRVRIGPIDTVQRADELLARMIHAGYTDTQVIVAE